MYFGNLTEFVEIYKDLFVKKNLWCAEFCPDVYPSVLIKKNNLFFSNHIIIEYFTLKRQLKY